MTAAMSDSAPAAASAPAIAHVPVMLGEALSWLAPRDGGLYIDGTFGAGGYTRALLESADCRVVAFDRDRAAIARGAELAARFGARLDLRHERFGALDSATPPGTADGVALDLGVSSPQIDDPTRGFSFRADGPLDMRMEDEGPDAAALVNAAEEGELAHIIASYGEERLARRIARAIVRARPLTRTAALADVVRRAVPRAADGIDPATRTFQALRIAVNDELGELDRGLDAAERALAPGGVLVVVAFHSLEDRAVKIFLRTRSGSAPQTSRHLPPEVRRGAAPSFEMLTRRPVRPTETECARNPRARSARLRAGRRTPAPPWLPQAPPWPPQGRTA